MAKGFIFVGGVIGILNHCNILLSNTMLNSFEKLAIHQQKLVYPNKKTILDTPNNQLADKSSNRLLPTLTTDKELQGTDGAQVLKDLGTGVRQQLPSGVKFQKSSNILSVIPPAQSETKNSVQLKKSSFSNILIPHYFIRQKAATTLLLPGTPSYLTRLLSSQQFPTLQQPFALLKDLALPIPPKKNLLLPTNTERQNQINLIKTETVVTLAEPNTAATPEEEAQEKVEVAEKEEEVVVALNAVAPEDAQEKVEVAEKEEEVIVDQKAVATEQANTAATPEKGAQEKAEVVVALNEVAPEEKAKEEAEVIVDQKEVAPEEAKEASDDAPGTNEITERVVTSEEKVEVAPEEAKEEAEVAPEEAKEKVEVAEKEAEVVVALNAVAPEEAKEEAKVAPEEAKEKVEVAEKEAEVVVALNAVAPEEAKEEAKVAPEEINKIPDSQSEESNFAPNISTENNLPNNFALEIPAPSNEQVDDVIKALPQEQIDQIVEEARSQELKVLEELKTFYRTLREELKNPPQKHDDSHKQKRELIVKNIDNILKDIDKSKKNIDLGISINRHKALVTENPFDTQAKLDAINGQRQLRLEKLEKLFDSTGATKGNYNSQELNKIEKFVQKSGKDIKHIANTRNDDMRRKFFSSIVDHTISFAKYNINWAPAAYNLTWAVGSYIIMGIVVDTIAQGAKSISNSYEVGIKISDSIKKISGQGDEKQTANLFTRSIATLSGIIGGGATMIIMPPIMLTFTGTKNVLYTPVGIYKNYQSYKIDENGNTKNWAKSRSTLKSERTLEKNKVHKVKEQKKFAETVQSQKPVSSNIR